MFMTARARARSGSVEMNGNTPANFSLDHSALSSVSKQTWNEW